jgi:PKD repeat protein
VCTPSPTLIAAFTATSGTTTVNNGGTITVTSLPQVKFTDTTASASRVWTITDASGKTVETSSSSTSKDFTPTYTTTGTYTVNLIVSDSNCATPQAATMTVIAGTPTCTVSITTTPLAVSGIVTVPTNNAATVSFTGSAAGTWSMTGPTGTAVTLTGGMTGATTSHNFAAGSNGIYTVKLTATPSGCTQSTATVTVNVGNVPPKITSITPSGTQFIIAGSGFLAAATATSCGSEVWYNTINSTVTSATFKPLPITVTGTTQITLTSPTLTAGIPYYFFVKNTCTNTWSGSFVYTVAQQNYYDTGDSSYVPTVSKLTADFDSDGKTQITGPAPLEVKFTNKSTSSLGILTNSWDLGDGSTSFEQNPTHVYTKPGIYSVTLTVFGFEGSATKTLKDFVKVTEAVVQTAKFTCSPTSISTTCRSCRTEE